MTKYIIETDQIALRELTMADFNAWHQILSDKKTMHYYPREFDEDQTRKYTISEIINAVITAGFTLSRFDEHPAWKNKSVPGEFTLVARR